MKRFAVAALFAAALLSMSSRVDAGLGLSGIEAASGGPGVITTLEDDDWELLVNAGGTIDAPGDNVINTGDFFVGMLRISQIIGGTDFDELGGETISALFAIKVTDLGGGLFSATNLTDGEWAAIGLDALGFDRVSSSTIAIVYDDPDNVRPEPAGDGVVSDDLTNGPGPTGPPAVPSGPNGPPLWEFGIGTDNFWNVAVLGGGNTIPVGGAATFALFNVGLDLTHTYAAGANVIFHDMDNGSFLTGVPNGTYSHLHINGNVFPQDPAAPEDFDLVSDADLFISTSVVPEPGSMILLGMGAAGMFGARFRRRRATRAQQQAV